MTYKHARKMRVATEAVVSFAFLLFLGIFASGGVNAQDIPPSLFSEMKWRMIGPFRAGKVNGVTGVLGNPAIYYTGADGGGVWKKLGNWEQLKNKDVEAFSALLGKNNLPQLPSMRAVAADVSCGN